MADIVKIKFIGLGGVGSCLLQFPFLNFLKSRFKGQQVKIFCIDGDTVEEKNFENQCFSRLGPKAEVTIERLKKDYPCFSYKSEKSYVNAENVYSLIGEEDIVFMAVDNYATRKLVSDRCEDLRNVFLTSGGNDVIDGNVQNYYRKNGKNMTLPLANKHHPEIQKPKDFIPGQAGCDVHRATINQLVLTNNAVSAKMAEVFYIFLECKPLPDEIYLDIERGNSRAVFWKNL